MQIIQPLMKVAPVQTLKPTQVLCYSCHAYMAKCSIYILIDSPACFELRNLNISLMMVKGNGTCKRRWFLCIPRVTPSCLVVGFWEPSRPARFQALLLWVRGVLVESQCICVKTAFVLRKAKTDDDIKTLVHPQAYLNLQIVLTCIQSSTCATHRGSSAIPNPNLDHGCVAVGDSPAKTDTHESP